MNRVVVQYHHYHLVNKLLESQKQMQAIIPHPQRLLLPQDLH